MGTENWERLGQAIRARRKHLGLAQVDVTAAGGPSDETLRRLEKGSPGPYMRRTLAALERVLKWSPGAVDAILAGEDPAGWELAETPQTKDIPNEVFRVGEQFLELVDRHYGTDPESLQVQRAVLGFLRRKVS